MPTLLRLCLPLLLLALSATSLHASLIVYIEGETQGHIQGDALQHGEEDNITLTSFSSSIYTDFDPASGRLSGRTRHAPVVLTKEYDRSSVPLTQAHITNERLSVVRLHIFAVFEQQLTNYYTIEMRDAYIVDQNQSGSGIEPAFESWGFVFNDITWTDEINGTSTTDRWEDVAAAVLPPGPSPELALLPPLPNPSAAETLIRFDLPIASRASLDVYDVRGRRITSLFDEVTSRDRTVVRWDGRDAKGEQVAHGLYLVKLRWPEGEVTQRVTLIR